MAQILPVTPPTFLPPAVLKTFTALKALPDAFHIWHHLAPWTPEAPDFLVVSAARQALLIKVSAADPAAAHPAAQLLLMENERPSLGEGEAAVLAAFIRSLALPPGSQLGSLVVFPRIPHETLLAARPAPQPGDPPWAGAEILTGDGGLSWEAFLPESALDETSLAILRRRFTPETVVPPNLTTRTPQPENIEAGLTDFLLDYDQEGALKADLELDPQGAQLTDDFQLNIINGVAGSGKTLILLYRLRLLHHLYPGKRFLVLTHNKPLRYDLESRFNRLEGSSPEQIDWHTFFSWCYAVWPTDQAWVQPLSIMVRSAVITAAWRKHLADSAVTPHMLTGEIDWIKDQPPMDEADYLAADRRGRGFGLTADQRSRLWRAYQAYQAQLAAEGACDWADIPQTLWRWAAAGQVDLPRYDAILIDETQFFAPLWIDLVKRALKTRTAHLFLVADPTQGFLGRRTTWKAMGVEARGRSVLLRKSYRTTREIMGFAALFYRQRLPDEQDDDVLVPNLLDMPTGATPDIIPLASAQDEVARVANEVAAFLAHGFPRKDIYVLHANAQGVRALITAINRRVGRSAAMEPRTTYPGDYVRVTTLNAGAGLESPIVFLVGLRTLFEEEQSLRLGDDERQALIDAHTRKIFMAATRAGQRLVFTYVGELPQGLRDLFGE
jgi:hypothetical protein